MTAMAASRGKNNDTDPMGDPHHMEDGGDDVDDMLNALEVSRPRQRKQPSHADANEAGGRGQTQKMGGPARRQPGGGATMPMMGAPNLPKEAVNAKVASDPVERAFLNRTEETAPRRRRDEKTMLVAPKKSGGYLAATVIGFAAVLLVGAVAWKMMKVVESQGPAPATIAPVPTANANPPANVTSNANANGTANVASSSTAATTATPTSTPTSTSTPTAATTAATNATAAAPTTTAPATTTPATTGGAPTAIATDVPAPVKSASPAPRGSGTKQPESKYGNVVAPEL